MNTIELHETTYLAMNSIDWAWAKLASDVLQEISTNTDEKSLALQLGLYAYILLLHVIRTGPTNWSIQHIMSDRTQLL